MSAGCSPSGHCVCWVLAVWPLRLLGARCLAGSFLNSAVHMNHQGSRSSARGDSVSPEGGQGSAFPTNLQGGHYCWRRDHTLSTEVLMETRQLCVSVTGLILISCLLVRPQGLKGTEAESQEPRQSIRGRNWGLVKTGSLLPGLRPMAKLTLVSQPRTHGGV